MPPRRQGAWWLSGPDTNGGATIPNRLVLGPTEARPRPNIGRPFCWHPRCRHDGGRGNRHRNSASGQPCYSYGRVLEYSKPAIGRHKLGAIVSRTVSLDWAIVEQTHHAVFETVQLRRVDFCGFLGQQHVLLIGRHFAWRIAPRTWSTM